MIFGLAQERSRVETKALELQKANGFSFQTNLERFELGKPQYNNKACELLTRHQNQQMTDSKLQVVRLLKVPM